jgi:hypothetical protein
VLGDPHVDHGVVPPRRLVPEDVLADHPRREVLPLDQLGEVPLRLLRQGQRGDLDAALRRVLDERAPPTADLQHVVARTQPKRLGGQLHLPGHRVFQRLVLVGEHALGVAAVPGVQEGQEELGVLVVVVRDRPPVVLGPPAHQRGDELRQPRDRVEVLEELAHLQRRHEVTVDVEPALQVGHRDAELVETGQRLGAAAVPYRDGEGRFPGPEEVRRLPGDHRERRPWPGREEALVPALQRADEIMCRHGVNVAPAAPEGSG